MIELVDIRIETTGAASGLDDLVLNRATRSGCLGVDRSNWIHVIDKDASTHSDQVSIFVAWLSRSEIAMMGGEPKIDKKYMKLAASKNPGSSWVIHESVCHVPNADHTFLFCRVVRKPVRLDTAHSILVGSCSLKNGLTGIRSTIRTLGLPGESVEQYVLRRLGEVDKELPVLLDLPRFLVKKPRSSTSRVIVIGDLPGIGDALSEFRLPGSGGLLGLLVAHAYVQTHLRSGHIVDHDCPSRWVDPAMVIEYICRPETILPMILLEGFVLDSEKKEAKEDEEVFGGTLWE